MSLKWTENHNQQTLFNVAVFKVQSKLWKEDKVFIKQATIRKVLFLCIENKVIYDGWHSLYLNCIIDGLESLIAFDRGVI